MGNEEGRHETPRHEGSSASQGNEGNEEGRHEASCHEGSSASQGNEGYEEGRHEAPRHEGSSTSQGHEGHEVNADCVMICPYHSMALECFRVDYIYIGCVEQH